MLEVPSKISEVKKTYEMPHAYLKRRRYNIRIRAETVREFVSNGEFDRILDVGCGDGSMSLQLLTAENHLTLVDLSSSMLSVARSCIPPQLLPAVEIVNDDIMSAKLTPGSYDLIICIGVLAHVESPAKLVEKITSLLRPGGSIIMEATDASHVISRWVILYHGLWKLLRPPRYALNLVSSKDILEMYTRRQCKLSEVYRYSLPVLPGIDRFIPQRLLHRMIRAVYGNSQHNRHAWLGNECIYLICDDRV